MSGAARTLAASAGLRTVVADYFEMTKPKVQSLLLFTTVTTMYIAGDPSLGLVALTCLGGALSAGGAAAINHALDRDIDALMKRTSDRPVASGRVSPQAAIVYGVLLGCASFALLSLTVNPLAAVLAMSGLLGYVLVYTVWLKRSTPQNFGRPDQAVTTGAHHACGKEFPTCNGGFMPFGKARLVDIHLAHRAFMYLASVLLIALIVLALRRRPSPGVARMARLLALLLVVQITLGALNVWLDVYEGLIVAHLAVGTLLWATAVGLTLELYPVPAPALERARGRRTEPVTA